MGAEFGENFQGITKEELNNNDITKELSVFSDESSESGRTLSQKEAVHLRKIYEQHKLGVLNYTSEELLKMRELITSTLGKNNITTMDGTLWGLEENQNLDAIIAQGVKEVKKGVELIVNNQGREVDKGGDYENIDEDGLGEVLDKLDTYQNQIKTVQGIKNILSTEQIKILQRYLNIDDDGDAGRGTWKAYKNKIIGKEGASKTIKKQPEGENDISTDVKENNKKYTEESVLAELKLNKDQIKTLEGLKSILNTPEEARIFQEYAKKLGKYNGPIDSILGGGSLKAFKKIFLLEKKDTNTNYVSKKEVSSEMRKTGYILNEKHRIKGMSGAETIQWNIRKTLKRLEKLPPNIKTAINNASERFGVETSIIKAKICTESGGGKYMKSQVGASGYMQLMSSTANELMNEYPDIKRMNRVDRGEANVFLGTAYLAKMMGRFDGDLDVASAAYNTGPSKIQKALDKNKTPLVYDETKRHVCYVNLYKKAIDNMS